MRDLRSFACKPILLQNNRVWRPFVGGELLDAWQHKPPSGPDHYPESWIGSLVNADNPEADKDTGLSFLAYPDKELSLKALVESAPCEFLGRKHARRFGPNPAVLFKALDSHSRLMIQCHPDRRLARELFLPAALDEYRLINTRSERLEVVCVFPPS